MKHLNFKISDKVIDEAISNALDEAKKCGISGKEATPFLLSAIGKITEGKSLQTSKFNIIKLPFLISAIILNISSVFVDIALIKNNAQVAAQIAVELSKIESISNESPTISDSETIKNAPVNKNY